MLAVTLGSRMAHARCLARSLACVALLLLAARPAAQNPLYTTLMEKTTAIAPLSTSDGNMVLYNIPEGQCSGYIDKSLMCGAQRAVAVQVIVHDTTFASVHIKDELTSATVRRARCDAGVTAVVELRVTCADSPRNTATRPRRNVLRVLPPAPK